MRKNKTNYKLWLFFFLTLFIIGWTTLLFYFGPQEIVGYLGVQNAYFSLFVLGIIAGISSFFATPFYTAVATFSAGGLDIFLMGLVAGLSITIGHSVYYYLGSSCEFCFSEKVKRRINKMSQWMARHERFIPYFVIFYFALTPFPNELIITPLGALGYSFRKFVVLLIVGNIALMYLIALVSYNGVNLF